MTRGKPTAVAVEARTLAEADLGRSGLTLADAEALGAEPLSAQETTALGHPIDVPSILFRYWDPHEKTFTPVADFHRVRYLITPGGFAAQTAKPQRYSQPKGSLNDIYVPRQVAGVEFDWAAYLSDAKSGPLYFTEGEKKAAAGCKAGLPVLALGGVTMWRAQSRGARELPTMSKIDFKGRDAYVVFDTDEDEGLKPEVLQAAHRLMEHLLLRGATPSLVVLPTEGLKKAGLDDYLLAHGREDFLALAEGSTGMVDARALCRAAGRYAYVTDVNRFISLSTEDEPVFMTIDHADHALSKAEVSLPRLERVKVQGGGSVIRSQPKVMRLADALLTWEGANKFSCSVYRPGLPRVVLDEGRRMLNLWTGWRCDYEGEAGLPPLRDRQHALGEWSWALDNVFGDDPVARAFVDHWILYPLKHPGAKLYTFALVCSPEQGIGKSFIGHMLAKHVYGLMRPGPRHAWQLSEGDLQGQFNPYLHAVSFIEGDDITATDKKSVYERVKSFVTSDTVQVNLKGVPQFMVENRANFWLTSNEGAPFFLSDQDRRAFVHVPKRAKKDDVRYRALEHAFEIGVAGPSLLWHARERYSAGSFNPHAPAPATEGKIEVSMNGRSSLRDWAYSVVGSVDGLTRPYATPRELYALMQMELPGGERNSVDAMGHALRDAGASRWASGAQVDVRLESGARRRERVWSLATSGVPSERTDMSDALSRTPFNRKPDGPPDKVVPIRPAGAKKF